MSESSLGVITSETSTRRTDYLYRISIKCLIRDGNGNVLVVKETGRGWWDLPGGGMDHGESIRSAIAREMEEEVSLKGDFEYHVISIDEPAYLKAHHFWQVRLVFELNPDNMVFNPGVDADEVAFISPEEFRVSNSEVERRIFGYSQLITRI